MGQAGGRASQQPDLALAERGDLGGMSFGFVATDTAWPAKYRRELRSVELHEISVVSAWPAYQSTEVQARAGMVSTPRRDAFRAFLEGIR